MILQQLVIVFCIVKCMTADNTLYFEPKNAALAPEERTDLEGMESVRCPDNEAMCPDGQTCCKGSSEGYACCPFNQVSQLD